MRTLGPKSADPMQTHAGAEMLDHLDSFGFGVIDVCLQTGLREYRDGNYDVVELERNGPALTIIAVAHGGDVLGRDAVLARLDAATLTHIREKTHLIPMGQKVAAAMLDEIDRGLLQYLGSPADVIAPYRANIAVLASVLDQLRVPA